MAANRIVSTGRRQDYPKETWGPRDRAREARLKRAAAGIRKPERWEPISCRPTVRHLGGGVHTRGRRRARSGTTPPAGEQGTRGAPAFERGRGSDRFPELPPNTAARATGRGHTATASTARTSPRP